MRNCVGSAMKARSQSAIRFSVGGVESPAASRHARQLRMDGAERLAGLAVAVTAASSKVRVAASRRSTRPRR